MYALRSVMPGLQEREARQMVTLGQERYAEQPLYSTRKCIHCSVLAGKECAITTFEGVVVKLQGHWEDNVPPCVCGKVFVCEGGVQHTPNIRIANMVCTGCCRSFVAVSSLKSTTNNVGNIFRC